MPEPDVHAVEYVATSELRPHPRNYRAHPPDQIEHLAQSLREHGLYRNVVTANDLTILAGHGVVLAAEQAGLDEISIVRLPIGPEHPKALKLLAADNEIAHLSVDDDRELAELLRTIRDDDLDGLFGTGYDDAMLANLVFVTRAENEIADRDDAAAWVGLPDFEAPESSLRLIINVLSESDRQVALAKLGITAVHQRNRGTWSVWFPPRERADHTGERFEAS